MGFELKYQIGYDSTINNLALRENVIKILSEVNSKTNLPKDAYPHSTLKSSTFVHIDDSLTSDLHDTVNFLESKEALKLLSLTSKHALDNESVLSVDFNIDMTKINIFAA